ncbi:Cu2+-exporting ATPase [Dysgonomonas sp. PFB1-18]|uniref:copper-translocating P-type ATPase n=1 Tax=unclassified Dysgonomonas TaxID=2630389 RepID=UPI0024769EC6|nr:MULTISPECIES: copper-translocating P-type ATPase [unclassified Dysgonomonas]MDH6307908.1 Cu2+-exporting ATPase [Dysgonomonas sp. PF1-14]MDH6337826.1 Cu2+-exporting ATPase [Dysgonomonas sp. PF1-16]MDH6379050.1 Cu2+-exporting ATPase [Dysgonomonas sp. PFB1-18]MDH6396685.1 Cu2+-exporting ATPase [Dysgonomonas sp. PF1-23]
MKDRNISETRDIVTDSNLSELRKNCILSLILCIPLVTIALFFRPIPYANYIMWALATPVVVIFGRQFYIRAWQQLKRFSTNMDTLVALSTGTAYLVSVFNTLPPAFRDGKTTDVHVYFSISAIVVAFVLLGRYMEEKAKKNTELAIKKLIGLQPRTATVIRDNTQQIIRVKDIAEGDEIIVKPGERIPADGKICKGTSFINESMISGEPLPVEKGEGQKIFAGTVNEANTFHFIASKADKETLLAQTIKMVQEAQLRRRPIQKMVDKVCVVYIPIVGIVAITAFLFWFITSETDRFTQGMLPAINILIIACPCALGLAAPTAIMAGINRGMTKGILIKGSEALENAYKLTSVVLDKTGTITEGVFYVTNMEWFTATTPELKGILYAIETYSAHPLADAVRSHLKNELQTEPDIKVSSLSGRGLMGEKDGDKYYVGTLRMLEEQHIVFTDSQQEWIEKETDNSNMIVLFAKETSLLAIIAITDRVKPTSLEAIGTMKHMGLELYMLTGDNKRAADLIARQVGVSTDNVRAGALPSGKAAFIKELQDKGEIVAMTGDGINDSGALAAADVSVAMGQGSDIAMEVAQMTITSSDLNKFCQTIRLSKATVQTMKRNLFFAFIYNIIGIPVAAGILYPITNISLNPTIAGIVIVLSTISVAISSYCLRFRKI